jgi:hypothetical protein
VGRVTETSREFVRKQAQHNRERPDAPLPRLVLHGLRHTWATLALHEGIDIQVISEAAQPLEHTRYEGDQHARDAADAERRDGAGGEAYLSTLVAA